jgi:NADH-quinone oxidoreductase subunit L
MFLGLGVGAYSAGIFHVMTHAFFKALLFLGAGSVIHALSGEQDLRMMGGLRKKIPITFLTLFCAAIAISGVPPFSGFMSKDAILLAAHHHHPWMYWVGVVTAGMTAFYVFRAIFMCFFGTYRGNAHPHESPLSMTVPLGILALLSLGGGYLNVPHYLEPMFGGEHAPHDTSLVVISVMAGATGILLAFLFYIVKPGLADGLSRAFGPIYRLVYDKYRVDELYDATIVHPTRDGSRILLWRGFDVGVIDGIVNGAGSLARLIGGGLRYMQSGYIRRYAAWVVLGAIVLMAAATQMGGRR